jgi:hypothetical protein
MAQAMRSVIRWGSAAGGARNATDSKAHDDAVGAEQHLDKSNFF